MTTPVTQALLPVTQADRDAAADLCQWFNPSVANAGDGIRSGRLDDHYVTQILARHRKAQSLPGDVGMREALQLARDRIADMLMGDDGQAWKEARKALPIIDAALPSHKGAGE